MTHDDRAPAAEVGRLSRPDLLVLASLEPGRGLPAAEIAKRSGVAGRRTARSLRRLQRRSLLREGGEETYVPTPRGAHLHGAGAALAMVRGHAFEPPDAMEAVVRLARQGDGGERVLAIRALGCARRTEHAPLLAEVLAEEEEAVAAEAARALVRSGGPEALQALRGAAGRGGPELRAAVADALGVLRHPGNVGPLVELSGDSDPGVRKVAARALGMVGERAAAATLVERLADEDSMVRGHARDALIGLGGVEAIAALRADPRRNGLLRRRDAHLAGRAADRSESRGAPVDSLASLELGGAIKGVAMAGVIVLVDVLALHANLVVLAAAAAIGAAVGSARANQRRKSPAGDRLDVALGGLEDCPAATVRPTAMTAVAALGMRPVFTATWLILPLGVDLAMTGVGIVPGLGAGLLAGVVVERGRDAARIRRYERGRGVRLCTWSVGRRRHYCSSPSAGSDARP